jgi:hypothetical protein
MKSPGTALLVCLVFAMSPVLQAGEIYGEPEAPLVAEVLGTDIHTVDPEEMKYVILGRLQDRYAAEQGIRVSRADIDAYLEAMHRVAEQDRQRRAERRDKLRVKLAATSPEDPEHKALSSQLESLDQLDASLGAPGDYSAQDRAAREQVAAAFIRQWKVNRALYRQYGGRIIFQQGGPEPLDAWRAFLEEQQGKAAFRILDKSLETGFWEYYVNDSIHSFYPAGSGEEAQVFETPWWLLESSLQAR